MKKILICGAGSVGVYVGTMLNSRGHDVKLFGRRKLSRVGDKVLIDNKEFEVPERLFEIPKKEDYDFLFITTKLYDFEYMIKHIKKNKIRSSIVSAIQNGLVDTSKYSSILGKKIIPVVVFSGLNLKENKLDINSTPVGWKTEKTIYGERISRLLLDAGIPCKPSGKFDSLRAEKTIVNCSLNALSAIENKTFKELFERKKTRERIFKIFDECYDILRGEYNLEKKEEMKKNMIKNWSRLNHYSSTCQDIRSGRKTEVKYFNGYIAELGKKNNLLIKSNFDIIKDIKNIEKRKPF